MEQEYMINGNDPINSEFESYILSEIEPVNAEADAEDHIKYAYDVYCSLNSKVSFDPKIVALNLHDESSRDKVNRKISGVNRNNNYVNCIIWSNLYAYFLTKAGFRVNITGNENHKKIEAFYGNYRISADATTPPDRNEKLNDITRAHLGMRPTGFSVYDKKQSKLDIAKSVDVDNEIQYPDSREKIQKNQEPELKELINIINTINLEKDRKININNENFSKMIEKIVILNEKLRENKLDNVECIQYLKVIFNCIFSIYNNLIELIPNLFLQKNGEQFQVIPLISLCIENKYLFFIMEMDSKSKSAKIRPITKEEIIEKVRDGTYILIEHARKPRGIELAELFEAEFYAKENKEK